MAKLTEKSAKILEYVKANDGKDLIAADIAEGTGLEVRSVNGSVTAFQKKGLMVRVPAEVELEDGTHKAVKLIKLTDAGRNFEDVAEDAE